MEEIRNSKKKLLCKVDYERRIVEIGRNGEIVRITIQSDGTLHVYGPDLSK